MTSPLIRRMKMVDKFVWYLNIPLEVVQLSFSNTSVGAPMWIL
jgi:hypothetical protein